MSRSRRARRGAPPAWVWVLALLAAGAWLWAQWRGPATPAALPGTQRELPLPPQAQPSAEQAPLPHSSLPDFLPREAAATIALIQRGGPFAHRQDGSTFGNRERLLPAKPRGYYREYTVDTPGLGHRGARRIITGGDPPQVWYYTGDHYRSFRQFEVPR